MRIAIMGAGGLGGYYGAMLQRGGESVAFIARGAHLRALQHDGLRVDSAHVGDFHLPRVTATDDPATLGEMDVVLMGVKSYDLAAACNAIRPLLGAETFVVPLLNGVDMAERIGAAIGPGRALGATVFLSCNVIAPGHLRPHVHLRGTAARRQEHRGQRRGKVRCAVVRTAIHDDALRAGRLAGQPVVFATNQLTILAPADNPADLHTPADLAKPGLRLVLAAPGAPVRQYSDQRIALMGDAVFQTAVYANLASEEPNVRQVATRVLLGEADAGIVYASDVTPDIAGRVLQIAIQAAQNVVATYPIVVVGEAPGGEVAQAFADFVLGPDGQSILQEWGFGN